MVLLALATIGLTLATPTSTLATALNSTPNTLNSTVPLTTTAGPGDTLFTYVYQTCNHTFPVNDTRICLTPLDYPGTLCHKPDVGCATGERVASSLHTWSDEHSNCSTYAWTWRCSGITEAPTAHPTPAPTLTPTVSPSTQPPTQSPTPQPTTSPTLAPTNVPNVVPTEAPTAPSKSDNENDDDGSWLGIQWYWWIVIGATIVLFIGCAGYNCYKYNKKQQRVSPTPPGMQERGGSRTIHNEIYTQPASRPLPDLPQQSDEAYIPMAEPTVYVTHTIPEYDSVEI